MRVLIAISCLLAVASAGYHGYHVPVIGPHGVPVDEPAVAAAKAHHFAAHAEAAARGGHGGYDDGSYNDGSYHDDGSYQDNGIYAGNYAHEGQKWHGPIHIPVIGPHGVPIEEPAVQHARAEHLAAHHGGGGHGLVPYAGHYAGHYAPAINHGAPHDTPEVAAARAAHLAAHAEVASRGHYGSHYRKKRGIYGYAGHYAGPHHVPVIGPHGVPLDEPAVAHAKAEHAAAHAKAAALAGAGHYGGGYEGAYQGGYEGAYQGDYSGNYAHEGQKWHGPIHIPVIGPHGVPVDEPAVQHARAEHLAAHHGGGHGYGGYGVAPVALGYAGHYGYHGHQHIPVIGPHGVPLDEPAVAHAKAEHAAAHAQAAARSHGGYHHW